jgi:tetratricopeptide (TPR) repeat protein
VTVTREFSVGVHLFAQKEYRRAIKAFQEALVSDPRNPRVWSYLGISLAHSGRPIEAEQALGRAVAIGPENGECWFHLGVARSLEGKWLEASHAYRRATALIPNDLTAWHRLGVALAEIGDKEGSSAAFERALILSRDPDGPGWKPRPVRPPIDDHLTEPAEREGPKQAESWLSLALSLLTLGEVEEAIAAYERGYELDPNRARTSMFRPMLSLLTSAQGAPTNGAAPGDEEGPDFPDDPLSPPARPRPTIPEPPLPDIA